MRGGHIYGNYWSEQYYERHSCVVYFGIDVYWQKGSVFRKISQNWYFIVKKVEHSRNCEFTKSPPIRIWKYASCMERGLRTPMFLYNMFSRGQAKFTNSSHSQVHFSSLLKALRYRNWLTEGQHTNRWHFHVHTFFVQKFHQSSSTELSLSSVSLMELNEINVFSHWPCSLA